MLLSRDEFRNKVFQRDNGLCVMCSEIGVDAHHIIERRLFDNGGYYLDNGATLCSSCHILAEKTDISVETLLEKIRGKRVLPDYLYSSEIYDKWGNIILPNKQRLKGPLYFDESVQKILKDKLSLFTKYVKYPRTYHLPWSRGTSDDKTLLDTSSFQYNEVVITTKMDGENTSLYNDYIHARSIDSKNHPSRNWIKNFHSQIKYEIPEGWRVCGENLFATHTIYYNDLRSYFYGFSIWNEKNECLSWDETLEWFELLNIVPVEVLYRGIYDINNINMWNWTGKVITNNEGYIIRMAGRFDYIDFHKSVAKFVNDDFKTDNNHWMYQEIKQNQLGKYK